MPKYTIQIQQMQGLTELFRSATVLEINDKYNCV